MDDGKTTAIGEDGIHRNISKDVKVENPYK